MYAKAYEMIDAASTFPWPDDLEVMMDFELAMRSTWSARHPTHRVRGCLFHITQVYLLNFKLLFSLKTFSFQFDFINHIRLLLSPDNFLFFV